MRSRLAVLSLLAACACASTSVSPRDLALAKVNDETITGERLRQEFARSHRSMEKILGEKGEVRRYLGRIVDRRLFLQEGYRMGIHETTQVREALAKFRGQKMLEAFLQDEIEEKAKPSDDEVFEAYTSLIDLVEARHAVFRTKAEADAALAAVATGGDLEKIAREQSIVPTALKGGMIAIRWGGDARREKALFALKEGELAPVYESGAGWEIARVEKRRQVPRPPFDKVSAHIRGTLEKRKRAARQKDVIQALWTTYDARVVECAPTFEALEAAAKAQSKDETPCATWRGGGVTTAELIANVQLPRLAMMKDAYALLRPQLVEDLLNRKLGILEAEARGYGNRPEIVEKVREHEEALVESALYAQWVIKDISVTEDDAKAYYDSHLGQFVEDAHYDIAQIVVDTAERGTEVQEKLRTGQPFEEVAQAYTKDKEAAQNGGYFGLISKKSLKGDLDAVASLGEGEVSAPIKVEDTYRIIKVLRVLPERQRAFEEVKDEARGRSLDEKRQAAQASWLEKLRAVAKVKLYDRAIRKYEKQRTAWLREEAEKAEAKKTADTARAEALVARAKALPGPPPPEGESGAKSNAEQPSGDAPTSGKDGAPAAAGTSTAPAGAEANAPAAKQPAAATGGSR